MSITPDSIVRDVVKLNFKTAPLFQANNIDFCCGGNRPISEACNEVGINAEKLIKDLEILVAQKDPDSEYVDQITLSELCDYIVNRHHSFVNESIPFLKKNLDKICQVHGENHPELFEIRELFNGSAGALTVHMKKEELMLFPFIKRLELSENRKLSFPKGPFGSVSNPISMMVEDHQHEGDRFKEISILSNDYKVPENGCTTYEVTLKQLRGFEEDLHRHIHLENNILFPKAIEMENNLI